MRTALFGAGQPHAAGSFETDSHLAARLAPIPARSGRAAQ